jgi:hypothetical protein
LGFVVQRWPRKLGSKEAGRKQFLENRDHWREAAAALALTRERAGGRLALR